MHIIDDYVLYLILTMDGWAVSVAYEAESHCPSVFHNRL